MTKNLYEVNLYRNDCRVVSKEYLCESEKEAEDLFHKDFKQILFGLTYAMGTKSLRVDVLRK